MGCTNRPQARFGWQAFVCQLLICSVGTVTHGQGHRGGPPEEAEPKLGGELGGILRWGADSSAVEAGRVVFSAETQHGSREWGQDTSSAGAQLPVELRTKARGG